MKALMILQIDTIIQSLRALAAWLSVEAKSVPRFLMPDTYITSNAEGSH